MQLQSLTKENFWNIVERMCPKAFGLFNVFIDDYKIKSDWHELFKQTGLAISEERRGAGYIEYPALKFHDPKIPYELQLGVILRFFYEYEQRNNKMFGLLKHPAWLLMHGQPPFAELFLAFAQLDGTINN